MTHLKIVESNIPLFAVDRIMYRKIMDNSYIDMLQTDLNSTVEIAVENKMQVNPGKSNAVSFTKTRMKND